MKKIFGIFLLTILMIATAFAQGMQAGQIKTSNSVGIGIAVGTEDDSDDTESDVIEVSQEDIEDALEEDSIPLCVRYLKEKYPNADVSRLNIICEKLRNNQQVINSVVKRKVTERIQNMNQLSDEQKQKVLNLGTSNRARLNNLDEEELEKIVELSKENIEKLSLLNRAKIAKLSGKTNQEIKQTLENYEIKRFADKADMFKKRTVQNYEAARERYEWLKQKNKEIKDELENERTSFREAVESGDEEASLEAGKEYMISVADLILNNLEKIRTKAEENDDLTDEELQEILNNIDKQITMIEEAKEAVMAAETKEEVKEAGSLIIRNWNKIKEQVRFHTGILIKSKVFDVVRRSEFLENKLERALAQLEDQGYDISEADSMMDEFSGYIDEAKEYYELAKKKFDEAKAMLDSDEFNRSEVQDLVKEGEDLLKQGHESLKDAHESSKDIIQAIRQTGSDEIEELLKDDDDDYYVVEDEGEIDDDDTGNNDEVEDDNENNEDIDDNKEDNENDEDETICCDAMIASCLACSAGQEIEDYCENYPETTGCEDYIEQPEENE